MLVGGFTTRGETRLDSARQSAAVRPTLPGMATPFDQDAVRKAEAFLDTAREYRTWSEDRMEEKLRRVAADHGCDVEIEQIADGWRVAFTQTDDLGKATLISSEAPTRHESMENVLLMAEFTP